MKPQLHHYFQKPKPFFFLLLLLSFTKATSQVTITSATGGTNLSADKAANATSPAYTALGNIVIQEGNKSDFGFVTNKTLTLAPPTGWSFNPGAGSVSAVLSPTGDMTSISIAVTAGSAVVTYSTNNNNRFDTVTISGLQVRANDGANVSGSGNIIISAVSASINGINAGSTTVGALSQVVGAMKYLVVTLPGQTFTDGTTLAASGVTGTATNQTVGSSFALSSLRATDQFYNIVTTYTGTKTITYSGPGSSSGGAPSYTTSVAFTSGVSTTTLTTSLRKAETTTITAKEGTLYGLASANLVVGAKTLTITGPAVTSKTYDGTTAATITGTLTGILSGDVVSLVGTGTFNTKNVGTNKAVTATCTTAGADGANYIVTQPNGLNGTITAATLTISNPAVTTKVYDGTTAATITGTLTGGVAGDAVSLTGSGTFVSKTVDTGKSVTSTSSLTGTDASNYSLTQPTGLTGTITAKALTITSPSVSSKIYDGTTTATITGSLSGIVGGGDSVTLVGTGAFSTKHVGTGKSVTATCSTSGADGANYTITQPTGLTGTITAKTLTITGAAVTTKNYDGTTAATITGTLTGVISGDAVSLTGAGTFTNKNVGSNKAVTANCTLSGADAANYNITQPNGLTGTINAKDLTITALAVAKDFNTTYTLGSTAFTANGLVDGETIGGVTLTSAGAAANAAIGTYPIVPSGATGGTFSASNYTITYTNGLLTVNAVSVGGTVNDSATICSGTGVALSLTGQVGNVLRWEYAVSPYTTWTPIANTTTTCTTQAITQTTRFRAVVQYGSSAIAYAQAAEITPGATTTWTSNTWSNGAPDATKTAVISSALSSAVVNITACSLTVNNNAVVVFPAQSTVTLSGALTVTSGSTVTFESNANLIQSGTTNTNSGNVTFKRDSSPLKRLDYTLWSSPVAGQQLQAFSPQTMSNRFYNYNTSTNLYDLIASPSTTGFETGKGYLIRVSNNQSATQAAIWTGQFVGVPNNGDYSFTLADSGVGNRFNLIGNPYPSTIDIDAFVNNTNNAVTITGALYFWRKTNGSLNPSYCTYTPLGGFVSNGHASAAAFAQSPDTVLQPGQGFFVEATGAGSGTVKFDNSMRTDSHTNHFLKNATAQEKNRIWVNVTNSAGAFSQTLIGYLSNATMGVDPYIDGKYINDGDIALASLVDGTPYAIQGRGLPFDAGDIVTLQFKATTAGEYSIALDHVDGLFTGNQNIYLRDNLTGTIHELHAQAYTFSSEAGVFSSRFELLYQLPLDVSTPTLNAAEVVIYRDTANNLIINTGSEIMSMVKVYDIKGSLLTTQKEINANHATINLNVSNEVVLVQVTSDKGVVVTKKYMMQRMSMKKDKETMVKVQLAEDE